MAHQFYGGTMMHDGTNGQFHSGGGRCTSTAAVDELKILPSAGTITAEITLIGIKKS